MQTTHESVYLVKLIWPFPQLWPWPRPDDLDIRPQLKYSEDVSCIENEVWRSMLSKAMSSNRQTHRHTQTDVTKCI